MEKILSTEDSSLNNYSSDWLFNSYIKTGFETCPYLYVYFIYIWL